MRTRAKYRLFLILLACPFWLAAQPFNFRNYSMQGAWRNPASPPY